MSEFIDAIVRMVRGHEGAIAPQVIPDPDGSGDQVVALRKNNDDGGSRWELETIVGPREPRAQHELKSLESFRTFAQGAAAVFVDFEDGLRCVAIDDEGSLHANAIVFEAKVRDQSAWWLAQHDKPMGQAKAVRDLLLHGEVVVEGRQELMTAISTLGTNASAEASTTVDGTGNQRIAMQKGQERTVVSVPERISVRLETDDPDVGTAVFDVFPYVNAAERVVVFTAMGVRKAKLAIARALALKLSQDLPKEVRVSVGAPVFNPRPVRTPTSVGVAE